MRVERFLHKLLANAIHKKRIGVLSEAVESALVTKNITLTALGRGINNKRKERSNIRKIDRLFANEKLLNEREQIYQIVSRCLLQGIPRPLIIVDSVKLPRSDMYALRASCPISGRTHTLYEMLYPKKREGSAFLHNEFLQGLKSVIPEKCHPIIVTDAGFHNPWFKLVMSLGWDYIGRIRGLKIYRSLDNKSYCRCSSLWKDAVNKPQQFGEVILSKANPLRCFFYLYKKKLEGRFTKETKDNALLHYARSVREPWLLASSLDEKPHKVINMYRQRMKIEESFRDMKSFRYGLGLTQVWARKPKRYGIILLIVLLTNFIACLIGQALELKKKHYEFQANSIKNRRVLSYFYLGCQAFKKKLKVTLKDMKVAWKASRAEFAALL
jgi:hypothetical protein